MLAIFLSTFVLSRFWAYFRRANGKFSILFHALARIGSIAQALSVCGVSSSSAELFSREVASLNEFRKFFGLKTHDTFESINPDPEISDLLRKIYDSPDMVELYPGLFVEDAKPRRDPGSGFNAPYTVGRAVLSDAVTLVRGDRFYTLVLTILLSLNLEC